MIPAIIISLSILACGPYNGIDIGGQYFASNDQIYICASQDKETQEAVKTHEYGHYFWFKKMTHEQRDEWTNVRNEVMIACSSHMEAFGLPACASLYEHSLNSSVIEDFAFMFEHTYYHKDVPELYKPVKKLIKDYVYNDISQRKREEKRKETSQTNMKRKE